MANDIFEVEDKVLGAKFMSFPNTGNPKNHNLYISIKMKDRKESYMAIRGKEDITDAIRAIAFHGGLTDSIDAPIHIARAKPTMPEDGNYFLSNFAGDIRPLNVIIKNGRLYTLVGNKAKDRTDDYLNMTPENAWILTPVELP